MCSPICDSYSSPGMTQAREWSWFEISLHGSSTREIALCDFYMKLHSSRSQTAVEFFKYLIYSLWNFAQKAERNECWGGERILISQPGGEISCLHPIGLGMRSDAAKINQIRESVLKSSTFIAGWHCRHVKLMIPYFWSSVLPNDCSKEMIWYFFTAVQSPTLNLHSISLE